MPQAGQAGLEVPPSVNLLPFQSHRAGRSLFAAFATEDTSENYVLFYILHSTRIHYIIIKGIVWHFSFDHISFLSDPGVPGVRSMGSTI